MSVVSVTPGMDEVNVFIVSRFSALIHTKPTIYFSIMTEENNLEYRLILANSATASDYISRDFAGCLLNL